MADTGRLQQDLPDLLAAIAEAAAERKMDVGLFIDEVQYLSADEPRARARADRLLHWAGPGRWRADSRDTAARNIHLRLTKFRYTDWNFRRTLGRKSRHGI